MGFGLGVVRFGDFIAHALPASFDPDIGITVIDPDHPEHGLVLYTNLESDIRGSYGLEVFRSVVVTDEEWLFHFTAPRGYGLGWAERAAWILILIMGLLFSVIILSVALLFFKGRRAALALAVERQGSEEAHRALA